MTAEEKKARERVRRKRWELQNKAHLSAYKKAWQSNRIAEKRNSDRERYLIKRPQIMQRSSNYYANNRDTQLANSRKRRMENREYYSAKLKKRRQEDTNFRILARLRSRIAKVVRRQGAKKSNKTIELLGCSADSFHIYIESKFEPGMTWENIHLDHIVPCALFDFTKPEHQKICFHFSNYQPLFVVDNLTKSARVSHTTESLAVLHKLKSLTN